MLISYNQKFDPYHNEKEILFVRDNYKKAGRSYKHTPKQTLRELALYNKNPQLRDYLKNYLK